MDVDPDEIRRPEPNRATARSSSRQRGRRRLGTGRRTAAAAAADDWSSAVQTLASTELGSSDRGTEMQSSSTKSKQSRRKKKRATKGLEESMAAPGSLNLPPESCLKPAEISSLSECGPVSLTVTDDEKGALGVNCSPARGAPDSESESEGDLCSICLDELRPKKPQAAAANGPADCPPPSGTPIVSLAWEHEFHLKCIARWLSEHDSCPCCKSVVEFDSLGSEDPVARRRQRRQAQLSEFPSGRLLAESIRGRARRFGFVLGHGVSFCSGVVVLPLLIVSTIFSLAFVNRMSPTPPPPTMAPSAAVTPPRTGVPGMPRVLFRQDWNSSYYFSRGCSDISNWGVLALISLGLLLFWTADRAYRAWRLSAEEAGEWIDVHDRSSSRRCCRIWNCFTMFLVVFVAYLAVLSTTCVDPMVRVAGYAQGALMLAQYICLGPLVFYFGLRWFQRTLIREIEQDSERRQWHESDSSDNGHDDSISGESIDEV